jgi:hypothetical protein
VASTSSTGTGMGPSILQRDLVGNAITILKNMKVNGKDDSPYTKWKIKVMFETNQGL